MSLPLESYQNFDEGLSRHLESYQNCEESFSLAYYASGIVTNLPQCFPRKCFSSIQAGACYYALEFNFAFLYLFIFPARRSFH
jgi:hypothetical protein